VLSLSLSLSAGLAPLGFQFVSEPIALLGIVHFNSQIPSSLHNPFVAIEIMSACCDEGDSDTAD
jgi:hypothetical protein